MKFIQHYSGSKGNLYEVVSNDGKRLLIEAGVVWPTLQKALKYDLKGISGCLLSHEHQDHSKATEDVMRAGIDVYASYNTLDVLDIAGKRRANVLNTEKEYIGCFEVYNWKSNHDASWPVFFIIKGDNEYLLFATDTSFIRQIFWLPFSIVAIECSYDKEILTNRLYLSNEDLEKESLTRINKTLAKRLLNSHMEKQTTIEYLDKYCDLSKCRQIHLLHMSRDNIDAEKICKEIENKFFIETVICS